MPTGLSDDTIAAISTPPGEGAIAMIRISGPDAIAISEKIFPGASAKNPRTLHHGAFLDGGARIDEGLLAIFRSPRSYTGEDMAELHCHGGILVTARLLEAVLKAGARAAEPGEFTRRAFLNGKMDLTQAEAVMDVIQARTTLALRAAEAQLEGQLGHQIESLREKLLVTVAHIEACIDFPEEGISPHVGAQLKADIDSSRAHIHSLLSTADEGRILREGVRLVLCGAPNAGKSSLLNRLLGFDRAIVSETPGTTRDTIEELASLHGIPFRITDTAGLRETADLIEQEGVTRARNAIAHADVVLRVASPDAPSEPAANPEILAWNKIDLPHSTPAPGSIPVSCKTGEGIATLVDAIVAKVRGGSVAAGPTAAAINARHQACLLRALEDLALASAEMENEISPEFVAAHLRAALDAVGEVVGRADIEEILGRIFSTFCIGK